MCILCAWRGSTSTCPTIWPSEAKAAGLNISRITQEALRAELATHRVAAWLEEVARLPPTGITHEQAMAALDEARRELWGDDV